MQSVGQALGGTDEAGGAWILAHADHHPLAGAPGSRDGVGLHVVQKFVVDPVGRAAQGKFTQGRQVTAREVVAQRTLRIGGHVDFAGLQALDEVVGIEIHHLDVVGTVEDAVGHRLADPDARDLRDDIIQALDVLDVERRMHVDAGREQFLDILIALRVARARRIAVSEFVNERQGRASRQQGIEIHLVDDAVMVGDPSARNDLEAFDQGLGFAPSVGLHDTDHHVDPILETSSADRQHLVSLADPGRGAKEDLEAAASRLVPTRAIEQRLRRGTVPFAAILAHRQSFIPCVPRSGLLPETRVQSEVQGQDIHARLAEKTEGPAFDLCGEEVAHPLLADAPRTGHARHLE